MIHKKLSAGPDYHYGTNVNHDGTRVLLQLGDGHEQVRVRLTPEEVDQVVADLQKRKRELADRGNAKSGPAASNGNWSDEDMEAAQPKQEEMD